MAASDFSCFDKCYGIEICKELHDVAEKISEKILTTSSTLLDCAKKANFICGDVSYLMFNMEKQSKVYFDFMSNFPTKC